MSKYVVLTLLAVLTMTCAVLEGLIAGLPPQFIQVTGLLTIVCTGVFIFGVLNPNISPRRTAEW